MWREVEINNIVQTYGKIAPNVEKRPRGDDFSNIKLNETLLQNLDLRTGVKTLAELNIQEKLIYLLGLNYTQYTSAETLMGVTHISTALKLDSTIFYARQHLQKSKVEGKYQIYTWNRE